MRLSNDDLFRRFRKWYREDIAHVSKWRKEAREDFNFYNNHQWSQEDLQTLNEEKRPSSEFNRIHAMVDAVVGTERNNKRKVQFIPRSIGKSIPNSLLTGAADWFREQSCASHADSQAFKDCVISGMGWTSITLDYEDNPEGIPVVEHLDPLKMGWDHLSRQSNLRDARRLWYVDMKPVEQAKQLFPGVNPWELDASWHATGEYIEGDSYDTNYQSFDDRAFNLNDSGSVTNNVPAVVCIVECRWYEHEEFYLAPDLQNGGIKEYSSLEYRYMREAFGPQFEGACFKRRVAYKAFLGKKLLEEPSVVLTPTGFLGWECMTGYYDNKLRHHYGVVRTAKEPQRWANKFFSQMMHILNCTAKGGFLVEAGAFVNPSEAMEALAQPDGIVEMQQGALTANKIQLKPTAQVPNGYLALFSEARDAIPNVTGLSREFIGTREADQAGVLEEQRRQSSFNLLAELFDSVELYRIRQGRTILYLIQEFLSDGRLIRICGDRDAQYVPLLRKDIVNVEYDIIIDEAPLTPNQRDRTFLVFMQMLPVLRDILPQEVLPDIVLEFMSYSPMPATDWERIKQRVQEAIYARQLMMQQQMQQQVQQQVLPPSPAPTAGNTAAAAGPMIAENLPQIVNEPKGHLPIDIQRLET